MARLSMSRIESGKYAVNLDGKPTGLTIEKGEPPKYGYPQEWNVLRGEVFEFTAKGKGACFSILETILGCFLPAQQGVK